MAAAGDRPRHTAKVPAVFGRLDCCGNRNRVSLPAATYLRTALAMLCAASLLLLFIKSLRRAGGQAISFGRERDRRAIN